MGGLPPPVDEGTDAGGSNAESSIGSVGSNSSDIEGSKARSLQIQEVASTVSDGDDDDEQARKLWETPEQLEFLKLVHE